MEQVQNSHRESPPSRPGVWDKGHVSDEDFDDEDLKIEIEAADHGSEDASKSLLSSATRAMQPQRKRPRRRRLTAPWPLVLAAIFLSMLLGAAASLGLTQLVSRLRAAESAHRNDNTLASASHDPDRPTKFLQTAPCGRTPREARAAGCLFDLVSFNWLPPACHDAGLAAEFEQELEDAGLLSWYEDMGRERPLTRAQVATGEYTGIYVSLGYHLRHCTAMWRRMHRALMEGEGGLGRVDSYIWSYHHTRHCEEMLLTQYNETAVGDVFTTEVRIKYPDCGVLL